MSYLPFVRPIFPDGICTSGPTVQPFKLSQLVPVALLWILREVARDKGKELRENLKQR